MYEPLRTIHLIAGSPCLIIGVYFNNTKYKIY